MDFHTQRLIRDAAARCGRALRSVARAVVWGLVIGVAVALGISIGAAYTGMLALSQPHRTDCTYAPNGPFGP